MMNLQDDKFYYVFTVDTISGRTDKALQLEIDGFKFWAPKSQLIGWNDGINKQVAFAYWFANEKGLLNKNWNNTNVYAFKPYKGHELKSYLAEHGINL